MPSPDEQGLLAPLPWTEVPIDWVLGGSLGSWQSYAPDVLPFTTSFTQSLPPASYEPDWLAGLYSPPVEIAPGVWYTPEAGFFQVREYGGGGGGGGGGGVVAPDYSREVAQIQAEAERDVARMQVDADRYQADREYQAAVDVAARQIDALRYQSDMQYRQAVDAAAIAADAQRDVARMQVDADRYATDAAYRQAVDVANINAYTERLLGLGQLGLGYFQTLAQMQQAPADWIAYWYATQGERLPEGYRGPGIPEGLQLPAWLQSLYAQAGYEPERLGNPIAAMVGMLGRPPELLGPPAYGETAPPPAWYEALPAYQRATPEQRAIFRAQPYSVQQFLARATPQELQYITGAAEQEGRRQAELERYYAGIAGKSPEEVERINRYLRGLVGAV